MALCTPLDWKSSVLALSENVTYEIIEGIQGYLNMINKIHILMTLTEPFRRFKQVRYNEDFLDHNARVVRLNSEGRIVGGRIILPVLMKDIHKCGNAPFKRYRKTFNNVIEGGGDFKYQQGGKVIKLPIGILVNDYEYRTNCIRSHDKVPRVWEPRFNMTNENSFKWCHTELFDSLVDKYKSLPNSPIFRVTKIQLRLEMLHLLFVCIRNRQTYTHGFLKTGDSWRESISLIIEGHRICSIFSDTLNSDIYLYHIDTMLWDDKTWENYMDESYRESLDKDIREKWNGEFINWDPSETREQFQTNDRPLECDEYI